jgi:hypothetical protein
MKTKLLFRFAVVLLLLAPTINFAQLPNLGTAENFAIFTTGGALSNTATSDITGDIGTNTGAISGFGAPTIVNGNIDSANGVTAQCAIDVQNAYNELFATTPTDVGHTPAFGSGETLFAGVYAIGAAGSVGGNLTLDAAGDPDAIFIFQFGGAFTTGASSTINLINGALACNIFWIAEGAIAMAALTDMKGTLIASNGAISMGQGGILEGRMLSTAGAASVYETLVTLPSCPSSSSLPIELLSFTGYCDKQNIILQWSTATEINNNYFTIERSTNGITWQTAGTVDGAGNSSSQLNYALTDMTPNEGTSYYRLKQTDFNGINEYSAIIYINKCEDNSGDHFTIYPNPFTNQINVKLNSSEINQYELRLYNVLGGKIMNTVISNSNTTIETNHLPVGIYFYEVIDGAKTIQSGKLISQ